MLLTTDGTGKTQRQIVVIYNRKENGTPYYYDIKSGEIWNSVNGKFQYGGDRFPGQIFYDSEGDFAYYFLPEPVIKAKGQAGGGNSLDPSRIAKITQAFFITPGIQMESYSTNTFYDGKSPVDVIINAKTLKLEGIRYKTFLGYMSFGVDGSFGYGNSLFSYGFTVNGVYFFDLSIPTSKNTSIGLTFHYNSNIFLNNMNYIMNTVGDALSRSRTFYSIPVIPIPILVP